MLALESYFPVEIFRHFYLGESYASTSQIAKNAITSFCRLFSVKLVVIQNERFILYRIKENDNLSNLQHSCNILLGMKSITLFH